MAKKIGEQGYDVVTGGGPGMMEAANEGHMAGDSKGLADSIGLIIKLPWENSGNPFLEMFKTFDHFSNRLDTFLKLSNAMVITKGGIGTLLELYYMWQHLQVHHVSYRPIILIGEMWEQLIDWMKKYPLKDGMIGKEDFDYIYIVRDNEQAMELLNKFKAQLVVEGVMKKIELKDKNVRRRVVKKIIKIKAKRVVIKKTKKLVKSKA